MKRNLFAGHRRSGGLSLDVFTADELQDIHLATLEVLERTGVWVELDEALDIFADGGCLVDRDTRIVRIPPHVVEDAIRSAPAAMGALRARPQERHPARRRPRRLQQLRRGASWSSIPYDGELRESTKQDLADIARLVDALPTGRRASRSRVGCRRRAARDGHAAQLRGDDRQQHQADLVAGRWTARRQSVASRWLAAVQGSPDALRERPILILGTCPVSPLKLPRDCCEIVIEAARAGVPSCVLSMAMAGGSSPVTLAGTLVTHNAEVLAGIALTQLTERGSKVLYGSSTTAMDLRLAAASVGSPECALISAGVAQLARQYRLPSYIAGA